MNSDSPHRRQLLADQLHTLRRMADVYRECRASFIQLNLHGVEEHTATLDALSKQLRACTGSGAIPDDVRATLAEVHALNRTYAEVVRRSLRSTTGMLNLIQPQASATTNAPAFQAYV